MNAKSHILSQFVPENVGLFPAKMKKKMRIVTKDYYMRPILKFIKYSP